MALAVGAVLAIGDATGARKVGRAFESFHPGWMVLAVAGQLLSVPAYVLAYRSVSKIAGGEKPSLGFVGRVVLAGFGPFMIAGGFGLDRRAARVSGADRDRSLLIVLAMGFLEWAVLAPAACAAAIVLLLQNAHIEASLLWPWAIAVPLGFGAAMWLSTDAGSRRFARLRIARPRWVRRLLDGLRELRGLVTHAHHYAGAWIGIGAYWASDIAGFYGAVRAFGLHPSLGSIMIAYATGYIGTRRSLPLGGAGITEVLLVYALYWVGEPIAPALTAVIAYRGLDFAITLVPGLLAYLSLHRRVRRRR